MHCKALEIWQRIPYSRVCGCLISLQVSLFTRRWSIVCPKYKFDSLCFPFPVPFLLWHVAFLVFLQPSLIHERQPSQICMLLCLYEWLFGHNWNSKDSSSDFNPPPTVSLTIWPRTVAVPWLLMGPKIFVEIGKATTNVLPVHYGCSLWSDPLHFHVLIKQINVTIQYFAGSKSQFCWLGDYPERT